MKLGQFFTLEEMTHSQAATRAGIKNLPDKAQTLALTNLVINVLDPLRKAVGRPVVVSSGFRSEQVNKLIGGSATSQHRFGEAADITIPGLTNDEIVTAVKNAKLPFDQMIEEFGSWVHISYGPRHRREILRARTINGKTVYSPYT